ncbi:MAG TPA: hypothetical protein VNF99_00855 [Stellaceae bacterium]|nr:hypothetical protein [Stellaceae bacterium]
MRAFRVERSFAAALLMLAAVPAFAQTGAPVELLPPAASAVPHSSLPAPMPAATDDGDIQAEPLAPVDSSWTGTLGAADHALPRDMWAGTPRGLVDAALPLLQPTTSPVLQDLARRLLLSDAVAPPGQDPADGPSLTDRRLDRLLALGRIDGAPLIDALPQNNASEGFDRDAVELRIANNDRAGACRTVTDRVGRYRDSWWDRALVACQALTGAYDQATLGMSAMRDQKAARDPVFEALIDDILGHRRKLERLPDPTPLRMALLAAAKLPLPRGVLAAAGPAALAVWATSDKVPIAARLLAGEKAEALGALPPAGLGLLYGSVAAKPGEPAALLKSGKLADDPRSRAILYNLARISDPGAKRVAALAALVADARRRGTLVAVARLIAPLVVELQPTPEFQSFAGDAARVLLAARDPDRAGPWVDLAGRAELHVLAAFARESGGGDDAPPPLADAIAALTALDAAAAPRQAVLLVTLAAALGEPLGGVDGAGLLRPPHQGELPNGALWLDQRQAAKARRVGETVLTTLLIAASGDRLSAEPIVLAQAIAGLEAVGLGDDARALAVEAALDAGI